MGTQAKNLSAWYRYYGRLCEEMEEGRTVPVENKDGGMFNYIRKEPYGVVGAITPWNSPLLTAWKLAPALAAGNTFVHKPSEETPVSALRFAELLSEHTDLPDGVYNVVTGDGETGAALADHEGVDKLAFTGSTAVGREVAKKAGDRLIEVSLELGGKSPNIVFPDANLGNAINGVMKGIFAATGQTCLAGSRVLVHEAIRDEFVERLTDRAGEITLGDPLDEGTEMGPVAFRDQWEKITDAIDGGLNEGATLQYRATAMPKYSLDELRLIHTPYWLLDYGSHAESLVVSDLTRRTAKVEEIDVIEDFYREYIDEMPGHQFQCEANGYSV